MIKPIFFRSLFVFLVVTFISTLFPPFSFCEIKTITHTVKQPFGGSLSPDDARIAAVARAKREALEMAGAYIERLTVVKNNKVSKDEILALATGVLKAEVVSQNNYQSTDTRGVEVVVKVVMDTSVLEVTVRKLLQDRTHMEQLNQARKETKELLDKIADLEVENLRLMAQNKSSDDLKKQFQEAAQGLEAVDRFDKALALWDINNNKYTDTNKAIEYLNEAIRLKPNYATAYYSRGLTYANLGQYQKEIEDYDEAIRLKPDYAIAYNNRGIAYFRLGRYQRAIEDINEAIRLKPDYADAYYNRGIAYTVLGQHKRAIEDYNQAILLKPTEATFYNNRGIAHGVLRQFQLAVEDADKAIRLKPDYADAYYNRGIAYADLGQYQRAISDYDEAIRLKPDYANAYYCRGIAYSNLGQHKRAIEEYNQLIRLKPNDAGAYITRGLTYGMGLGQSQRAIEDFNKAISLKPDSASAYSNRGRVYIFSNNMRDGCRDMKKACELGDCEGYEFAKSKTLCR